MKDVQYLINFWKPYNFPPMWNIQRWINLDQQWNRGDDGKYIVGKWALTHEAELDRDYRWIP